MKVLVVFGSERGGTAGLAEMIGAAFRREGWIAEVRDAKVPGSAADADVVVVGGALYLNRWHRDARRFVREHRAQLSTRPVWLFSSGPLDRSARTGDVAAVAQVQALARDIEARGHMTFGGRLEPAARGLFVRAMARRSSGDWRDEQHVAEWAREICGTMARLLAPQPGAPEQVVLPRQREAEPSHLPAHTTS
jgi:menaquinone-dependent protoporphyrinogen oxidase